MILSADQNGSDNSPKKTRIRTSITLAQKKEIIDLVILEKRSYASVGRLFNRNESTIRQIVKEKDKILKHYTTGMN